MADIHEKQIQCINSETGDPLEGCPVFLEISDGSSHFGYTDIQGMTPLVVRPYAFEIKLIAGELAILKAEK